MYRFVLCYWLLSVVMSYIFFKIFNVLSHAWVIAIMNMEFFFCIRWKPNGGGCVEFAIPPLTLDLVTIFSE
jgi:hypothetical protein